MEPPLILTALLDEQSQHFFNRQRQQYFPPERNFLQAHLTLFHHLPDEHIIIQTIENSCAHQQIITLNITGLVSTGKGVAYKAASHELMALHKQLQQAWRSSLTPQDAQGLWLHITVQNKVPVAVVKNTLQELQQTFVPFTAQATGLVLWKYLNGPWELYQQFPFAD